ncbi:hypothetical protein P261_01352 [Lachnospiraceae bacterium TWA4]|nr:hypothetical protein P261_01352 [Lachnospiraceae bacterium TWA4]
METKEIEFDEYILERILDIGSRMLIAGGEIHRVDDTISRLCFAYGALYADVFTITSSIVVTVRFKDREPMTQTRRIGAQNIDLANLAQLNDLSRQICKKPKTCEEISESLNRITPAKNHPVLNFLVWALISANYTIFFGGSKWDAISAAIIGILLLQFKNFLDKYFLNYYLVIILCSMMGGILSVIPLIFQLSDSPFYINIGNIMLLIPGITLTTAIRDMFSGDTISGLLRFVEAIIVSMMIAWGFAVFDLANIVPTYSQPPIIQLATAFIGSVGFTYMFNNRTFTGFLGSIGGLIGWVIVMLAQSGGLSEYLAYAFAAIFVTLYAENMAYINRCPTTLFLTVGTIPLIPGKSLYVTMQYAVGQEWSKFISQGITTLLYAVAISAGIILVTACWDSIRMQQKKIKHKG